ncbi:MAG: stage 0 sporulation protein, partial [Deltaproteobacteria bacterium]|nr:stage 0 sporulation protein [Deltaproteobacteria bacterium]
MRIVGIRFKKAGRVYDFDAGVLELAFGDDVIIEVEKGIGFGRVAKLPKEGTSSESTPGTTPAPKGRKLKRVVRKADQVDLERKAFNKEREGEAFRVCADKIKEYKL